MSTQIVAERVFTEHRSLLVGVAYRVLGSVADAEDVVQEAWLRWSAVDPAGVVDPRAYLITVTTRLAIDRLRRARARREVYVGSWLPEPVSTGPVSLMPDVAGSAELADSVELALLVVLETLSPLERAVFVLREAFGLSFAEIGAVIGREEATARQLARRARAHVRERRPRYEVDRAVRRALTERFLAACAGRDLDALAGLLAADVRLVSDGGGKARAPRKVVAGADKVSRFLTGIADEKGAARYLESIGANPRAEIGFAVTDVNAAPAIVVSADGRPITVLSVAVADGRIAEVYLIANPDKLAGVSPTGVSRAGVSRSGGPGASAGA
jgi:RNA polymerase sigma-70 factor (ECF subfamily)